MKNKQVIHAKRNTYVLQCAQKLLNWFCVSSLKVTGQMNIRSTTHIFGAKKSFSLQTVTQDSGADYMDLVLRSASVRINSEI